jgi:hypothetical protein
MAQLPSSLSEARAVISTVPEEPLPKDCCERGCDRCVFTVYYEAIDAWRRGVESAWR